MSEPDTSGPEDARAKMAEAIRIAQENPRLAEERLLSAIIVAPDDPTPMYALARLQHDVLCDIDEAERWYLSALELSPRHADALSGLARLLRYHKKDLDGAERRYREAIDAAPGRADPLVDYAHFLEKERRDLDGAEARYRAAIDAHPDHVEALEGWARFLHHVRRDHARAGDAYRAAIAAGPDRADLRAWYAVFLQRDGAPDEIERAYEDALAVDPDHGFALANFALFLFGQRTRLDDAERAFERALEIEPDRWSTHWWYAAFLHEERGDRLRAARHYRRAVELEPSNAALLREYQAFLEGADRVSVVGAPPVANRADTLSDRGYSCEQLLDLEGAAFAYQEALAKDPDHGPTLRRFAALLVRQARHAEAEALLRRGVELAPRDGWAHGLLARFLARHRGDHDGADHHYRAAIAAGLHDPKWLGEYARFLEDEGDLERAEGYYLRALDAATPEVAVDYARFLERTDPDRAEEVFERALALAPDDVFPARQYARFLEDTRGDFDAAERWYERAVELGPTDALSLAWYARFLERRREDDLRAAHFHLRAARAEPDRAARWAAVVRFLLPRGLHEEACHSLRRWLERAQPDDVDAAPLAEALFYGLVYLPEQEGKVCFERLKACIASGERVGRFDPAPHLRMLGDRPDAPWVRRLANVLVDRMRA